ncbi:MAG TPA: hypothetical protein VHO28_01100 [Ignavibacteriales bacterium]|nr:hypothetical protein [Ignavibacteriales bacterium]
MSIKSGLADICCKVYEKGFAGYYDDNLPVRAFDNSIYITPYTKCKSDSLLSHVKSANILLLENYG